MDKNVRELDVKKLVDIICKVDHNGEEGWYSRQAEEYAKAILDAGYIKPSPSEQGQEIEKGVEDILCKNCEDLDLCLEEKERKFCPEVQEQKTELLLLFNSQQQKVAGEIEESVPDHELPNYEGGSVR